MSKLRSCPWCGNVEMLKLETRRANENTCDESWTECHDCGARGPVDYSSCGPEDWERLTRLTWNRRAPDPLTEQLAAALRPFANAVITRTTIDQIRAARDALISYEEAKAGKEAGR